jgi:hypothetical protein
VLTPGFRIHLRRPLLLPALIDMRTPEVNPITGRMTKENEND